MVAVWKTVAINDYYYTHKLQVYLNGNILGGKERETVFLLW
jgi:hypothetical protein